MKWIVSGVKLWQTSMGLLMIGSLKVPLYLLATVVRRL